MIWATVSSQSCFCWMYRASPSSAAKNIINLISVLTIWWCPCVESSLVLLEKAVCYDQCVLLAKLCLPLTCFILYSKAQFACSRVSWLPTLHPSPLEWKGHLFWGLLLESLVDLHRNVDFSFFNITGWGIDLDYCDIEWFTFVTNRDPFCCFWDCIPVLHFRFLLTMMATPFLLRVSCPQ